MFLPDCRFNCATSSKLRNVNVNGPLTCLPYLAVQFAQYGAMLVGLHKQSLFSTGAMVLLEALEMSSRPKGFDNIVRLVMSGDLAEPSKIVSTCEEFWHGLVDWAAEHDYVISSKRIPF
jgi:kanamycin nucleotidyltransferase